MQSCQIWVSEERHWIRRVRELMPEANFIRSVDACGDSYIKRAFRNFKKQRIVDPDFVFCLPPTKNGYGPTKTRKARVVPISDSLLQFLKELKLKRGDQEFVLPHIAEWTRGEQAKVIGGFCASVGITPVKFHDLRATFITNLLAQGESLARVMSIVGHAELRTTNGYLRRAGVDVKGGTDKLGYQIPSGAPGQVIQLVKA